MVAIRFLNNCWRHRTSRDLFQYRRANTDFLIPNSRYYHPQPLADALPRLRQALRYRIRERIFADKTPDTVTPEWFPDQPPELAHRLTEMENLRRRKLYEAHEETRQKAEQHVQHEIEKMEKQFSLDQLLLAQCTPLIPGLPCQNSRDYRTLYYRSQIIAAGEQGRTITRARAASQLGVSNKTLSVLRLKAGIATDEQFETMEITDPENVLEQVNQQFRWAAGRDFGKFLDNGSGGKRGLSGSSPKAVDHWVQCEMARDRTVTAYIQIASRERLATEQEQRDKFRVYEHRRKTQRSQHQSRPPQAGERMPDILQQLLAQVIGETCPRAFSTAYILRQIAMTPGRDEAELLAYIDLFSNLHPHIQAHISRGGKYEKKWATRMAQPSPIPPSGGGGGGREVPLAT